MSVPLRVLLLEDRPEDAALELYELHRAGFAPVQRRVETEADYLAALDPSLDLILADYALPQFDALRALELLRERGLDIPFIIVSGTIGEEIAVRAMQQGAADYLLKDRLARLGAAVKRALAERRTRAEAQSATAALQAAELKYRTLVEHIPAIVYIAALDASSSTLYINPQVETLLGFSPSEWLADPERWLKQLHPLDLDQVLAGVARAQAGGGPTRSEFRMLARDGRVVWFRDEAVLVRDSDGRPLFLQGVMLDITERKQAEQALLESEERYRLITENSGDLISMTDHDGRFIYVSPSYRQVLGYDPAALIDQLITGLVHPDDQQAMLETMLPISSAGATPVVLRLRHADGSWRWIEGQATAVERQGASYFVGIGRDITERRRLEAQFLQAQKMETVGQLAGGVAHDFNNLLTAINGYAELALSDLPAGSGLRADLEEIVKAADRAAVLTRQLLAFARKQLIEPRPLDLNDLIVRVEKLLSRLLGEGVELISLLAPDLSQVKADPGQIEQVLVNLAVNARDAMPGGGTLTIATQNVTLGQEEAAAHGGLAPGPYVAITIRDTGSGMDAATRQRVFEPFFTTKAPGRGTGLGLATCYGIVKQHGGHIWVASEPGRGSSFTIYLPQVAEALEIAAAQSEEQALPRGRETVLLAEDDEAVRALAARVLRDLGYTVLEAADGAAALAVAESLGDRPAQLLLTDLVMPQLNGGELFRRLRARWPGLKAIFISGYADDLLSQQAPPEREATLLHKPFSPAGLARLVRDMLDEARRR
jgi:two-component system cell cycle sensor histidine kinase/response regulator CckA